jgi:hypothetical protein
MLLLLNIITRRAPAGSRKKPSKNKVLIDSESISIHFQVFKPAEETELDCIIASCQIDLDNTRPPLR